MAERPARSWASYRRITTRRLARSSTRKHPARRRVVWLAVLVGVIAAALVIGARQPTSHSASSRLEAIAGALRCPSCVDESAAQANTPAAQAIRADIAARLRQGQSERQIVAYMVSRYGPWILLKPPASGLDLVVWVVPIAAAAGAIGVLGVAFSRARRWRAVGPLSDEDRACVEAALEAIRPADTPSSNRLGVS